MGKLATAKVLPFSDTLLARKRGKALVHMGCFPRIFQAEVFAQRNYRTESIVILSGISTSIPST